jgi:polar amino acid transport system substrate-binding protein
MRNVVTLAEARRHLKHAMRALPLVRPLRYALTGLALACALPGAEPASRAHAQVPVAPAAPPSVAAAVRIPNVWNPAERRERPPFPAQRVVRVLTDDEFPPLHFASPDGTPTGFAVEIARAACEELEIVCTIQARRFDTLLDALAEGRGDIVAAAVPVTAPLRERFGVGHPYFRFPARFVTRRDGPTGAALPALSGRKVAVIANTAHEEYLRRHAPALALQSVPALGPGLTALRNGEVDAVFADGVALSLWLHGRLSDDCCRFLDGPFLDNVWFGEGLAFLTRRDDPALQRAFDYALERLWQRGRYAETYLRFFPVSPF